MEKTKNDNYEVLIFDYPFQDIPKNQNPAFKKSLYYDASRPDWNCIIICRVHPESRESAAVSDAGYIVLDVSSDVPDVLHLGVFWTKENARIFTNAYVNRNSISEIAKRVL